jgi:predicted RNA-binding Zn ribbon-like protein
VPEPLNGTYRWTAIGGHLALDLCNTVSWRLDPVRRIDRLAGAVELVDWFATLTGLPAADRDRLDRVLADRPVAGEKALVAVKELRDTTIRALDAHLGPASSEGTGGGPRPTDGTADDAAADIARLAGAWRAALAVATTAARLPWRWRVEPAGPGDLVHVLALAVADLMHRQQPSGLRRCDGDGCGWLFLDTTRNHSRRWCDPLDCGNRARVRSYAERRRRPEAGR